MAYENIPYELKEVNNWVCWSLEDNSYGKATKKPIDPKTGEYAKSNDSTTWSDFETAVKSEKNYSGIGFMLGDGIFGIDIDDVSKEIEEYLKNDDIDNVVGEFIEALESYAEISPSGNGIHIISRGKLPEGGRRRGKVEMYEEKRFLTMTGRKIGGYNFVNDDSDYNKIGFLHNKYIGKPTQQEKTNMSSGLGNDLTIDEIIDVASKSKNGLRFKALYEGGWDQFYDSQSEADMAFVSDLAFWTARDYKKMDAIMRKSSLYRPKWDEKRGEQTYGDMTLQRAVDTCTNEFVPPQRDDDFNLYILEDSVQEVKKEIYSHDDTGNAERLKNHFGSLIRYNFTAKKWLYYDGQIWTPDNSGRMKTLADEVVKRIKDEKVFVSDDLDEEDAIKARQKHIKYSRNTTGKNNMLKECEHLLPIAPDKMDKDLDVFNIQNGYIDLKTGQLKEHDKTKFFTRISNTEYTDNADAPEWDKFLNDIFMGNQQLIKYIQRAIGYSLSGYTKEQVMFVLYGNGRNGKSVFLDILNEVFGTYAMNIKPDAIMVTKNSSDATPEIAKLDGARLVTTTEPNEGERFDEGLIKQLTGGDRVTARKLYENEFDFTPQFKLWMATNHKPYIRGRDEGIWRRMVIIPFEKQIPLSEIDYDLTKKLKGELSAIMNWCVEGYLEWQRIGLAEPALIKAQRDSYRTEMDSIQAFIEECCALHENAEIQAGIFFSMYDEWAKENNQHRMSSTKFGREISKRFSKMKKRGKVHYSGITINEEMDSFTLNMR